MVLGCEVKRMRNRITICNADLLGNDETFGGNNSIGSGSSKLWDVYGRGEYE